MKKLCSLFVCSICFSFSGFSQVLELDLAQYDPGKEHVLTYDDSRIWEIVLKSINPSQDVSYMVYYDIQNILMDPIDPPSSLVGAAESSCDNFENLLGEALSFLKDDSFEEKKWKSDFLNRIEGEINAVNCGDEGLIQRGSQLLQASKKSHYFNNPILINQGQQVVLQVSRGVGNDLVWWKFVVKGKPVGKWITHYGFGFVSPMNKQATYYSKPNQDTTTFTVTKSQSRGMDMNYLPSILFSFIPYNGYNRPFNASISGGIGANTDDVAILLGGTILFRQFIGVTIHATGKNQHLLLGKYDENGTSVIPESLDFEQLHEQKFRLHWGVTVSFRFSESPFSKSESDED